MLILPEAEPRLLVDGQRTRSSAEALPSRLPMRAVTIARYG